MSYAYDTIADIIRLAEENNISFGEVVLRYELENYDRSEEAVIREIEHRLDIFEGSMLMKQMQRCSALLRALRLDLVVLCLVR